MKHDLALHGAPGLGAARGIALSIGLVVALAVWAPGCGGGSSGGGAGVGSTAAAIGSGLSVLTTAPDDGATDVDPGLGLQVMFDADIDAATLQPGAVTLISDLGPVAVTLSLVTPRVVEVAPTAPLEPHRAHVLSVTPGVAGTAGERLGRDHIVRFTTGARRVAVPGRGPSTAGGQGAYQAGAASVDITPAAGVPLAGYGGGVRRRSFPDLNPLNDYTFLNPATGTRDPLYAKAVIISNGSTSVAILTLDAIATDAAVVEAVHRKAAAQGVNVPLEHLMVAASHTHSGPGCMSKRLFWQLTAADMYVDRVFQQATDKIAEALVRAHRAMAPAVVGFGREQVTNATRNRRHRDSPDLQPDSIDPELLVLRVDRTDGTPVATVWNFAIHGTHMGMNMEFSADIMGSASNKAEAAGAGGVILFLNGCEGDIAPTGSYDGTGQVLADALLRARAGAATSSGGFLGSADEWVDFGAATIDWSVQRQGQSGPSLNNGFLSALNTIGVGVGISLGIPQGWMETRFRFQAIRIGRGVLTSLPGEPIHELGLSLKQDGRALGFDHVMTAGLANGHGAYFTSEREYWHGGYEALASFFGPDNGARLTAAARRQMTRLRP
ncbi:MAG: neutral/alkaline non-lysosomal ceramidase N-terminal domain-containing protein [Planctomycetes bacterium]|nr:neutral/alkaline non-lysosomal ceramidase N-terminal domain-containing protein [Planctomycetota bacterium]